MADRHDRSAAGPVGRSAGRTRAAVAALCLLQFVDVLGVTVVVTALPEMLADTGSSASDGTLVATGYAMFFGGLLIFGARLGDRLGHRRTILGSLVVFAAGALLTATATSTLTLTVGRCVQGIGAACTVPSALTLLTSITPSGPARARAVAAWSATGAAAGASGFVLGGVVTDLASWRAVFWAMLPVSAVLAVSVRALVPPDASPRERRPLNLGGSVLLTAAVMLLVVGATLLGEASHRAVGLVLVAASAVVAAAFAVVDRRATAPLLPAEVVGRSEVRRGCAGAFLNTATTTGAATLITLYLQGTLARSPLAAAATLVPLSALVVVGSVVASRLVVRRPRERVTAAGLALIGAGIGVPVFDPASPVLVGAAMAVMGAGLGLASVATTSLATDVPERLRATASGLVNTSPQLGAAIGTALLLLVAAGTTGVPDRTTGAPVLAWTAAAAVALAGAAGFALLRAGAVPVRTSSG